MRNLFMEEGRQLLSIHKRDVMDTAVVNSVQNVPKIGEEEEQFKNFVKQTYYRSLEEKQTTKRSFQKTKLN